MKRILSLDLSTKSTGWSLFHGKTLTDYGKIKTPKIKGITKLRYPEKQLKVIDAISDEIAQLVILENPDIIVVEEINRHKNRIGGKSLDALHFFVLQKIDAFISRIIFVDSDGATGWRKRLSLNLSDEDKVFNKEIRRKFKTKTQRGKFLVDKKVLAQRLVNKVYKTDFDVKKDLTDSDVCDSIGLGHAFIHCIATADMLESENE